MLAQNNEAVHEAAVTLQELTEDDKIRLQCEARERNEGDRLSILTTGIERGIAQGLEKGKALGAKEQKEIDDAIIAQKEAEVIATLAEKDATLAEKDTALAEKDATLAAKEAEIAALRAQLKR